MRGCLQKKDVLLLKDVDTKQRLRKDTTVPVSARESDVRPEACHCPHLNEVCFIHL